MSNEGSPFHCAIVLAQVASNLSSNGCNINDQISSFPNFQNIMYVFHCIEIFSRFDYGRDDCSFSPIMT